MSVSYSVSYPYFSIAQKYGVDYGKVLAYVSDTDTTKHDLPEGVADELNKAMYGEAKRRIDLLPKDERIKFIDSLRKLNEAK